MTIEFRTIARFENAAAANMAKNLLAEEGIRAFLGSESIVGALWHEGIALGGIKLQVLVEDAEAALKVLEDRHREGELSRVDESEFGADAEEDRFTDEEDEGDETYEDDSYYGDEVVDADDYSDDLPDEPTEADQTVTRAFRASVMGMIFFPVQIVSMYYLSQLISKDSKLSPGYRRYFWIALGLNMLTLFVMSYFLLR
ncbi:MAG: putative signal transducing protein [Planctomycetaceae bacterium]